MFSNLSRVQKILLGAGGGVVVLIVAVILLAGGGGDDTPPTTTSTTSTTLGTPAPLTGLPATDPAVFARPAVSGKIGNNPEARPQVGLNDADIVYEEEVEGRITRFLAVYHSTLPERFGPVRSVRLMDGLIVRPIGGIFGYSGGSNVPERITRLDEAGLAHFNETQAAGVGATQLDRDHGNGVRPNILFFLPPALIDAVQNLAAPDPIFSYVPAGQEFTGEPAPAFRAPVGPAQFNPTWRWDEEQGVWNRFYGDTPFLTDGDEQVTAHNIVIQFVSREGEESLVVGEGAAWVFSNGQFKRGTWSRTDPDQPARYVDENGVEIALTPGRTWVEMPLGGGTVEIFDS